MEMNHFCLNVLHRITLPDFLEFMCSTFPYLYAVDADNKTIIELHDPDNRYFVMYEHVIRHRFPNLVGGFDSPAGRKAWPSCRIHYSKRYREKIGSI